MARLLVLLVAVYSLFLAGCLFQAKEIILDPDRGTIHTQEDNHGISSAQK